MKKIICIVLAFIMICLSGCMATVSNECKVFEVEGVSIKLTESFKEEPKEEYAILYADNIKLLVQRTPIASCNNWALIEYATQIRESIDGAVLINDNALSDMILIEYSLKDANDYACNSCLMAFFGSDEYYWNLTFSCDAGDYKDLRPQFIEWLQTVQII